MKKMVTGFIIFFMFSVFIFASSFLAEHSMTLFILKGRGDAIEAFKMNAYLNGGKPKVELITLSNEQKKQGGNILDQRSDGDLEAFSKNFGSFSAVIGMPNTEEGWPEYLGNGPNWAKVGVAQDVFDNLKWTDRVYLSFVLKTPPSGSFVESELSPHQSAENTPAAIPSRATMTPGPENQARVVRVEILNGCGITNAAEWAAQRMKGSGITIVDSGNADNFQYPKTIIRISGEIPAALEEALGRLGLSKDSIQEISAPNPAFDVVVIVGKDFRKLKRYRHE